ncbi:MAG: FHA domain-containing protein [Pirellulales bacterium]
MSITVSAEGGFAAVPQEGAPASNNMICVLDIIEGPARGRRFWLKPNDRLEVGRISSADVPVPSDPHMSRHHLMFEALHSTVRVRDVGSTNGTFVNNIRISKVELSVGDKIRAGSTLFEISFVNESMIDGSQILPASMRQVTIQTDDPGVKRAASAPPVAAVVQPLSNLGGIPVRSIGTAQVGSERIHNPVVTPAAPRVSQSIPVEPTSLPAAQPAAASVPIQAAPVAPASQSAASQDYPNLTLPSDDFPADDQVTRRIPLPIPSPTGTVHASMLSSSWMVAPDAGIQWFPYFEQSPVAGVFDQCSSADAGQRTIMDFVSSLTKRFVVSIVVNRDQLGKFATQVLDDWIEVGNAIPLSQTLALVRHDGSSEFLEFIRSVEHQDAAIIIGTDQFVDHAALEPILEVLSYPSLLGSLVMGESREMRDLMLKHLKFAAFQPTRRAGWKMIAATNASNAA